MSVYGHWEWEHDLPVFVYLGAPAGGEPPDRHFLLVGNRRIQLYISGAGTHALFDESDGLRWITSPQPHGTGTSAIVEPSGRSWGTARSARPGGAKSEHRFGPTWSEIRMETAGLGLRRTVLCPEGEVPWVLIRVQIHSTAGEKTLKHHEEWRLQPGFLDVTAPAEESFEVTYAAGKPSKNGAILAAEQRRVAGTGATEGAHKAFGAPHRVVLETLAAPGAVALPAAGAELPLLRLSHELVLAPGKTRELWFRFGLDEGPLPGDPVALFNDALKGLRARAPRAAAREAPLLERETAWHAAVLSGGASRDRILQGHTLNQGSAYSFAIGFNAAARDPLQHALPLVYLEPDLALSVLRNTCAWAGPDGDLPWALDGRKRPWRGLFQPSDQVLWSLWLASEYVAATGDLDAMGEKAPFHPSAEAEPLPLGEHLRLHFRDLIDRVGFGASGHLRILNADWNDLAIERSGIEAARMIEQGESVLNSAMAAWVLPVYAALADRLGQGAVAQEAREAGARLQEKVAGEWNGLWFHRAVAPDGRRIGERDCWLEVQPWAVLCGAATPKQARALFEFIDQHHRDASPLGARVRWPPTGAGSSAPPGEGVEGGIWFSINMTLIWALARYRPELAWNELNRMGLANHSSRYPELWEGTLSGPDAYNSPESDRPGRTWDADGRPNMMQSFPVNNLHCHAQPLLAFLRLLGVEPTPTGSLKVGGGGRFESGSFKLEEGGGGSLQALGDVRVETRFGTVEGQRGVVRWSPPAPPPPSRERDPASG